jgi:hypothetical protein
LLLLLVLVLLGFENENENEYAGPDACLYAQQSRVKWVGVRLDVPGRAVHESPYPSTQP